MRDAVAAQKREDISDKSGGAWMHLTEQDAQVHLDTRANPVLKVMMKSLLAILCIWAFSSCARATDTRQSALYAVNAAALASAMTYCETRHGGLQQGSAGAQCFSKARSVLAGFELRQKSEEVGKRCGDPATFNTCLTPEIARLVVALNAEFRSKGV